MDASSAWPVLLGVALLLGAGVGGLVVWLWQRKLSSLKPGLSRQEPTSVASAPVESLPSPIEIHLVLNVLNRMGMALIRDEHAQDGVAALADYLSDISRLCRLSAAGDPSAVQAVVERYVRLSEWQRSCESPATITWAFSGQLSPPGLAWALVDELQQMLRGLEGRTVRTLHIQVTLGAEGTRAQLVIDAQVIDPDPGQATKPAPTPTGWQPSGVDGWVARRTLDP